MLKYTSCLFATVVVSAYNHPNAGSFRVTCYHHLFLLVTMLSIIFHCTHGKHIGIADKLCARVAFLSVLTYDLLSIIETGAWWLMGFPVAITLIWIGEFIWPRNAELLHACLHVLSVFGANFFLRSFH